MTQDKQGIRGVLIKLLQNGIYLGGAQALPSYVLEEKAQNYIKEALPLIDKIIFDKCEEVAQEYQKRIRENYILKTACRG